MSLTLISTTDITSGTSNKVTIDNVFSANYKVYCIQFHNTNAGTQRENNSMDFRLVDSTGTEIAANYDARHYMFHLAIFDINLLSFAWQYLNKNLPP